MIEYRASTDFCLDALSGKWKVMIWWKLSEGPKRLADILAATPGLTKRVLIRELRELEDHCIISREEFDEQPPRVEYSLTEHGKTLEPIIEAMHEWGLQHIRFLQNDDSRIIYGETFEEVEKLLSDADPELKQEANISDEDMKDLRGNLTKGKGFKSE